MESIKCQNCGRLIRLVATEEHNIRLACNCFIKTIYTLDLPTEWKFKETPRPKQESEVKQHG